MASPFDAAMAAADTVQNSVFGEPVEIRPRARALRRGQASDTTREPRTVTGIFTLAGDEVPLEGSRRGADGRGTTTFAGAEAMLWLSKETIATLGYRPREGDAIVFLDRSTDQRWSVVKADPSDIGDAKLQIAKESDAAELG